MIANSYFLHRTACPACSQTDAATLFECLFTADPIRTYLEGFYRSQGGVDFDCLQGAAFVLRQCTDCELIYQGEIGSPILLHKLYEEWIDPELARQRDRDRGTLQIQMAHSQEIMAVLAQLGTRPARSWWLDFGMGWGQWCQTAQGLGCNVSGCELSQPCIEFAHARGIQTIDYADIPAQRFDFINTEQVFEHLTEPLETLRHLASALAPDGLIKIAVPDGARVPELLKNANWKSSLAEQGPLNPVAPLEHINCFNRQALLKLGERAGLVPVELDWDVTIEAVPRGRELSSWRRRLGRVKRAVLGVWPNGRSQKPATYQFFGRKG